MKKLKEEKGVTLIQVLAVLILASIIFLFTTSIMQFSSKQKNDQQTATKQLTNTTYSLKVITKDFRRATKFDILSPEQIKFVIEGNDVYYKIDSSSGTRNIIKETSSGTEVISSEVGCFYVNNIGASGSGKVEIKISTNPSTTDCTTSSDDITRTELQLRKGD